MGLSNKQRVFIEEYLQRWNATEAARQAGYALPNKQGPRLLVNVGIQEEIQARLNDLQMSADEALQLLADQARGDLGEFMDIYSTGYNLKLLDKNGKRKNTRLIKKIKQKTTTFIAKKESDEDREITETEIELYDAQSAIDKILRVHGRYKDKVDITTGGEKIESIDNERFDRAISTLADAIRESVSGKSTKQDGKVDTTE